MIQNESFYLRNERVEELQQNLTQGSVTRSILFFSLPMILGNMFQQFYNVADTLIVGRCIGPGALASVGASFTLMSFLTSILLGLCMGSAVFVSMCYGAGDEERMREGIFVAFVLIAAFTLILNASAFLFLDPILGLLQAPAEIYTQVRDYLKVVLLGMSFLFLSNFFTCLLRALGNSVAPLLFLGISALLNIGLDLLFVLRFGLGVAGAAWATVIAQGVAASCIVCYVLTRASFLVPARRHLRMSAEIVRQIFSYSFLTCIQQSVMNFGILMIQGLVNSFGADTMAAFAAAVKIDAFAYMPVQDFGNAFSTYIAQNHGARKSARIRSGIRSASLTAFIFCIIVSAVVVFLAQPLMEIFIDPAEAGIVAIGVEYLHIEGACYLGVGCLFLLYGLYRGLARPGMSVILTAVSLGFRVALAYLLAPVVGLSGIWWAIPIGWILADTLGLAYYRARRASLLPI